MYQSGRLAGGLLALRGFLTTFFIGLGLLTGAASTGQWIVITVSLTSALLTILVGSAIVFVPSKKLLLYGGIIGVLLAVPNLSLLSAMLTMFAVYAGLKAY